MFLIGRKTAVSPKHLTLNPDKEIDYVALI